MKIYVLIGEYGEYERHTTLVLGAFSSEQLAWDAVPKHAKFSGEQYKLYQEHQRRSDARLKEMTPERIIPPGYPFPNGWNCYRREQYEKAELAAGPRPEFHPTCEEFRVECFNLDAIEMAQVTTVGQ